MTIEEINKRYNTPTQILKEYEKLYCENKKSKMNSYQFDESDFEKLSVMMTLRHIGFSNEDINKYMHFMMLSNNDMKECLTMLNKKRKDIMEEIHLDEKRISQLDYLRYKITKKKEKL